jgi:hypothetical protein
MKPKRRGAVIGLVVLVLFAWAITAARGIEGRFNTTSGSSVRLTFLTTGSENLFSDLASIRRYSRIPPRREQLRGNGTRGPSLGGTSSGTNAVEERCLVGRTQLP